MNVILNTNGIFFKSQVKHMHEIYTNGTYLKENPTWHVEDSPWKAKQILKIIERNRLTPHTICEVGCGAGEILNQLYHAMPPTVQFYGYEVSPQAFELCQQRERERLNYYLKDILHDEKVFFDIVMAIDLFEHVEDYIGFLRKLREKGQYKIFHIPLDLSAQSVLRTSLILKWRNNLGHIHYFTKETALASLINTGYEILDYFYTSATAELPSRTFKAWLARPLRKMLFSLNKDIAVRILGGYSLIVLAR